MKDYSEVTTQKEMDALIYSMGDFHDSMTKEMHVINRGGVLTDHNMLMRHQFDAQVLIQSEWKPYGVELLFIDVAEMSVYDPFDYASAAGVVKQESKTNDSILIQMRFDLGVTISAKQMFYRIQPDYLGIEARLKSEVPSPKAITARHLEGRWRQCSDCSEAWEDNPAELYSVCPKCLMLTVLTSS